jgi:acetyltransferase-like isoleucine patch superfamily enzyme
MPGYGENNWILADSAHPQQYTYDISSDCRNNIVVLAGNTKCQGRVFIRGSNNIAIVIGSDVISSPVNIYFHSSDHLFFFGKNSTSNTATFEMGTNGTAIIIGEDCMFSAHVDATTDDHHGIVDLANGAHINAAKDILIEPHVWVGLNAMILKGVTIGFGSIIGARSVVTRNVPRKTAVAGSPARVIKSDVSWVRDRRPGADALQYLADIEAKLAPEA